MPEWQVCFSVDTGADIQILFKDQTKFFNVGFTGGKALTARLPSSLPSDLHLKMIPYIHS